MRNVRSAPIVRVEKMSGRPSLIRYPPLNKRLSTSSINQDRIRLVIAVLLLALEHSCVRKGYDEWRTVNEKIRASETDATTFPG